MLNIGDGRVDNRGRLLANTRKRKDNDPDVTGWSFVVCPVCYAIAKHWICGWIRWGRRGEKMWSLSFDLEDWLKRNMPNRPVPGVTARWKKGDKQLVEYDKMLSRGRKEEDPEDQEEVDAKTEKGE